jgi:hypothetical protein
MRKPRPLVHLDIPPSRDRERRRRVTALTEDGILEPGFAVTINVAHVTHISI